MRACLRVNFDICSSRTISECAKGLDDNVTVLGYNIKISSVGYVTTATPRACRNGGTLVGEKTNRSVVDVARINST